MKRAADAAMELSRCGFEEETEPATESLEEQRAELSKAREEGRTLGSTGGEDPWI